jgi:hypothetical protein
MLKSIAMRAARRAVLFRSLPASRMVARAYGTSAARAFGIPAWANHENSQPSHKFTTAHVDAKVPDSDYYKGHLMADHLEYLDDVLEKTVQLEESMQELHETHKKKTAIYHTIGWTDSVEMEKLFQDSAAKNGDMQRQIDELKQIVQSAKQAFAVDAPDGVPDGFEQEELQEISHIIGDAALHEDAESILQNRVAGRNVMGVDAPDGDPDAVTIEEMNEVTRIIEKAAELKDVILQQRELDRENRKVIGVDAPDGVPDSLNLEELLAIKYIIDEAARIQDKGKINQQH